MSLGISDPVTRETHGSGQDYFRQLAKEVYRILEQPIKVTYLLVLLGLSLFGDKT
jgi:hypothetical protein